MGKTYGEHNLIEDFCLVKKNNNKEYHYLLLKGDKLLKLHRKERKMIRISGDPLSVL